MSGWIKIHRQLYDHWIWQDPVKLKWWIDILLCANHSDKKVNIGNNLIDCKRGQTIRSLSGWSERWHTSKDSTRNFLTLLKKDGMIEMENLIKTTRITICKYESYQSDLHDEQTQAKRKPNASQTQAIHKQELKELKELKESLSVEEKLNQRKNDFKKLLNENRVSYSDDLLKKFFDYWTEPNISKSKMRFEMEKTFDIVRRIKYWSDNEKVFSKNNNDKPKFDSPA